MPFFRSLFTFKNKSTPSLPTTSLIIPSTTIYSNPPYSGSNIFLPPYPHDEFPVKPTPPASVSPGEEARRSVESEQTISKRASNRNTNPFSDNHRVRASASTDMLSQWRSTEGSSQQSSSNLRDSKATRNLRRISSSFAGYEGGRSPAFLLMKQPNRAPVKYLTVAAASRSSDAIATPSGRNETVVEERDSVVNLIASDESLLHEVDNEQIESPAEINFDTPIPDPEDDSTPYETELETTENTETMAVDQFFSQTSHTLASSPEDDSTFNEVEPKIMEDSATVILDHSALRTGRPLVGSPAKRSSPASAVPKAVKFSPEILIQPVTPTLSFSEPDSEPQRLSMMSLSSEQSAASSTTFSFTTACSSINSGCSLGSTDSMDSSSTIRPRRDSSGSNSTIKPNPSGSVKKESDQKSQTKRDLPPGATLIHTEEYKDYTYVVYSDKKGREWGKMYPKQKKISKSL